MCEPRGVRGLCWYMAWKCGIEIRTRAMRMAKKERKNREIIVEVCGETRPREQIRRTFMVTLSKTAMPCVRVLPLLRDRS